MSGVFVRLAIASALAGVLAGCASSPGDELASFLPPPLPHSVPDEGRDSASITTPDSPLQCVPYARAQSGIQIFGDAYTWWDKAKGRFERGSAPKPGAVLVLADYAGRHHAHLAVVKDVVSSREIRVDHANWLNDGAIYTNDPVVDVSEDNDWSQVKVWNIRTAAWGTRAYNVRGFIGPGAESSGSDEVARNASPPATDDSGSSQDASEADREVVPLANPAR